jgi:hypothetical protein
MPIDLGTPLNVILVGLYGTIKDLVVFEETLPYVRTYFYNKAKRRRATKDNKCQRMLEEPTELEIKERSISWPLGSDPKEKSIETTSILHAFAWDNFNIVGELSVSLDQCRLQISSLEEKLKQ